MLLAIAGLAVGAGLLTAGLALAGVGGQPGDLELLVSGSAVTSGALTSQPTWATTTACPPGFQGSAAITEFTLDGTAGSLISNTVEGGVAIPFTGALEGTVGALLNTAPVSISPSSPGTVEWVVGCYSEPVAGGSVVQEQSLFISVAAGATTYTASATGPPTVPTSTTAPTPAGPNTSTPPSTTTSAPGRTTASPSARTTSPAQASATSQTPSSAGPPASAPLPASTRPSGAEAASVDGGSHPGDPDGLLMALGAILIAGSLAAIGLVIRRLRARRVAPADGPDGNPAENL